VIHYHVQELVADTIADKEEWVSKIRDSCEYVRQFFDGENITGFNKVIFINLFFLYFFFFF
jgi:hypothetical protein